MLRAKTDPTEPQTQHTCQKDVLKNLYRALRLDIVLLVEEIFEINPGDELYLKYSLLNWM